MVAVTGTDGKTTVTTLVTDDARGVGPAGRGGRQHRAAAGRAIDDPTSTSSSSRRRRSGSRTRDAVPAARSATWLNFAPDHLDWHSSTRRLRAAKARIWADQRADDVAVANADDPVVSRHARVRAGPARHVRPRATAPTTASTATLPTPGRAVLAGRRALGARSRTTSPTRWPRPRPRLAGGATVDGCRDVLRAFRGSPTASSWWATLVACGGTTTRRRRRRTPRSPRSRGFDSVVLIAGGRNKGLDLSVLAVGAPTHPRRRRHRRGRRRGRGGVRRACARSSSPRRWTRPSQRRPRLRRARRRRAAVAGCASFDWYRTYARAGRRLRPRYALCGASHDGHDPARRRRERPPARPVAPAPRRGVDRRSTSRCSLVRRRAQPGRSR